MTYLLALIILVVLFGLSLACTGLFIFDRRRPRRGHRIWRSQDEQLDWEFWNGGPEWRKL